MAKKLPLCLRKWHKKNLIGEIGGERKINPSANPERVKECLYAYGMKMKINWNISP